MLWALLALAVLWAETSAASNVLMVTVAGTKSHKIPFLELAHGLIARGHNITFFSAFPPDKLTPRLEEVTPMSLVYYVQNFTNTDLLGAKLRNELPMTAVDVLKYLYLTCETLLTDPETQKILASNRSYDLLILDGACSECALGFAHHYKAPYMYLNTVGFYTFSLSRAGNPTPYSVTPFFGQPLSDTMNFGQRFFNTGCHLALHILHWVAMKFLYPLQKSTFGKDMPTASEMMKNVSFTLQNAHAAVTYPRAYLPNVAEIACIHCRPAKPLPKDLEKFISDGGDAGFIYISMGTSVRTDNMPEYLRQLFIKVFAQLPYRVLWKWEAGEGSMTDLPSNVKLEKWLPQQDILGHRKLRAFVTHGGLLSMFETVYHGVPVVTMPVYGDHDSNALKAEIDGYAVKLELQYLTAEILLSAINEVIENPRYRENALHRSFLLRDQPETPLATAIYWTEYVIRHRGAYHLQSPSKDMSVVQYYIVDVTLLYLVTLVVAILLVYRGARYLMTCRRTAQPRRNIKTVKSQ